MSYRDEYKPEWPWWWSVDAPLLWLGGSLTVEPSLYGYVVIPSPLRAAQQPPLDGIQLIMETTR